MYELAALAVEAVLVSPKAQAKTTVARESNVEVLVNVIGLLTQPLDAAVNKAVGGVKIVTANAAVSCEQPKVVFVTRTL